MSVIEQQENIIEEQSQEDSSPPVLKIRGYEEWGPNPCPECGAEPYARCQTATGGHASLPHKLRWENRPVPLYGQKRIRSLELAAERRIRGVRKLPLSQALRTIEDSRMTAFRERNGA